MWIDLLHKHSSVILKIKDDGNGFNTQITYKGNGLLNMQKRSEILKGKLQIQSQPEKGTTVELKFEV